MIYAALWLRGEPVRPADADAVIDPDTPNLRRLQAALAAMTRSTTAFPPAQDFRLHLASSREMSVVSAGMTR